jgi:hypothetical protein
MEIIRGNTGANKEIIGSRKIGRCIHFVAQQLAFGKGALSTCRTSPNMAPVSYFLNICF